MKKYAVILSSLAFLLTACASAPADSVRQPLCRRKRPHPRQSRPRSDGHPVPDARADDGGV